MIVNIPEVEGMYPVVAVGSALNTAVITSVVATPVADTVTAVAQVAEGIAPVPKLAVPLAMLLAPPPAEKLYVVRESVRVLIALTPVTAVKIGIEEAGKPDVLTVTAQVDVR